MFQHFERDLMFYLENHSTNLMHVTTYDYLDVVFRGTNTWVDGFINV